MTGPSSRPPWGRDEVDALLVALVAAQDRISAAMYALDTHPGHELLRRTTLTGRTRQRAEEVAQRSPVLWAHFAALRQILEQARALRDRRPRPGQDELVELTRLLGSPAIGLGPDGLPVEETAGGPAAVRLTVQELARRLEAASGEVAALLDEVDAAHAQLLARLTPLSAAVQDARVQAAELAPETVTGPAADAEQLAGELTGLMDGALADPLASTGSGLAAATLAERLQRVTGEVAVLRNRLVELHRLREGYPRRVAQLRTAVDELAALEARAGRAYAVAAEKIADPGLPPAPAAAQVLEQRLGLLDLLFRDRQWPRLADDLADTERQVGPARERAEALRAAADGLLARRAELRGRLEAYRAKAGRLGLAEHEELAQAYRQARDLLYTSPCDLPAATRALVGYQHLLAGPPPAGPARDGDGGGSPRPGPVGHGDRDGSPRPGSVGHGDGGAGRG